MRFCHHGSSQLPYLLINIINIHFRNILFFIQILNNFKLKYKQIRKAKSLRYYSLRHYQLKATLYFTVPIKSPYLTFCCCATFHSIYGLSKIRTIVDPRLKYPIYSPMSKFNFSLTTIRPTFKAPTNIIPK